MNLRVYRLACGVEGSGIPVEWLRLKGAPGVFKPLAEAIVFFFFCGQGFEVRGFRQDVFAWNHKP